MASTQSGNPKPNFGRRIKWLGIATAMIALIYSGVWYWVAVEGEKRLSSAFAEQAKSGRTIECVNHAIKGYPFRLGLFCDKTVFADDERGIVFNAGALRSAAQVYNPTHAVVELDGPAFMETQDIPPLEFDWALLHASVRAAKPVPNQVSVESKDLKVTYDGLAALVADLATFHMRKEEVNVAFAGEWNAVTVSPDLTPGRTIPTYSILYDVVVADGVRLLAEKTRSARGQSGEIRLVNLTFAEGGALKASGPISVNSEGLISGDVKLTFADAAKLGAGLSKAIPEAASSIGPALTAAGMASGKDKEASLTLTIRDGKISAGLIPLGTIPPIK